MRKHWTGWTLGAVAAAITATAGFACDGHAPAAEAKDATGAAATAPIVATATPGDAKGCDMPCCAHAKDAALAKAAPAVTAEAPCTAHDAKGCPKKAATAGVAKADPAKDAPRAQPAAESPKALPATDPGTRH